MTKESEFILAVSHVHHVAQRLLDVTCGNSWRADLETAVADFVLAAASVRNRFEEMEVQS